MFYWEKWLFHAKYAGIIESEPLLVGNYNNINQACVWLLVIITIVSLIAWHQCLVVELQTVYNIKAHCWQQNNKVMIAVPTSVN